MKRLLMRVFLKKQILCNWDDAHFHLSGVSNSGSRKHTKIIRNFSGQTCNIEFRKSLTSLTDFNSCS